MLGIKIENYKSIKNETINFEKPITYIIGKNESGKSNILDAIQAITKSTLAKDDKHFQVAENQKMTIEYWWDLSNSIAQKWNKIGYRKKILIRGLIDDVENSCNLTILNRNFWPWIHTQLSKFYKMDALNVSDITNLKKIKSLNLKENIKENNLKNKIVDLINETFELSNSIKIVKFNDFEKLKYSYKFEEALASNAFKALWKLLKQDINDIKNLIKMDPNLNPFQDLTKKLNNNLQINFKNFIRDFWDQETIDFEINIKDDSFIVRAADAFSNQETGKYRSVDRRSKGMISYLTLVLFLEFHRKEKDNNCEKIILFDEPDKHLHASAVNNLREYIEHVAKKDKTLKFVIATHNPYFINENNFVHLSFVDKSKKEWGTKIMKDFAKLSGNEDNTTIAPFLYKIGIDRRAFISLSQSYHVFVEGIHDVLLLNAVKNQFGAKKVVFIPLGSATKSSSLVSISIAFTKTLPYFIFDFDKAGNQGVKIKKKNKFINDDVKNFTFINGHDTFQKGKDKIETQDLFSDLSNASGKKITINKNTNEFIKIAAQIKNKKITIGDKTTKTLQIIFDKINKYFNKYLK